MLLFVTPVMKFKNVPLSSSSYLYVIVKNKLVVFETAASSVVEIMGNILSSESHHITSQGLRVHKFICHFCYRVDLTRESPPNC